jgi:hypothetical protein
MRPAIDILSHHIIYKELRTRLGLRHVLTLGNKEYALTFVSVKNNVVLIGVIVTNM